jgi:hypothetical protein
MGWKSTLDISRTEAIHAIITALTKKSLSELTNKEIEDLMYKLGIGDSTDLPYYGYNFNITNDEYENT